MGKIKDLINKLKTSEDEILEGRETLLDAVEKVVPEEIFEIKRINALLVKGHATLEVKKFGLPLVRVFVDDNPSHFSYALYTDGEELEKSFSGIDELCASLRKEVDSLKSFVTLAPPISEVESYLDRIYKDIHSSPITKLADLIDAFQLKRMDYSHLLALHINYEEYQLHRLPEIIIESCIRNVIVNLPEEDVKESKKLLAMYSVPVSNAFSQLEKRSSFPTNSDVIHDRMYIELKDKLLPLILLPYTSAGEEEGVDSTTIQTRRDALVKSLPVCREVCDLLLSFGSFYYPDLWFADKSNREEKLLKTEEQIRPIYEIIYGDPHLKSV